MLTAIEVISPLVFIIALGFVVFKREALKSDALETLNKFVFLIAAPALLFRNTAITDFPEILPWGLWGSYFGSMVLTVLLAMILSSLFFKNRSAPEKIIIGFGSGFSNTVMLGIPVILISLGNEASIPLFLILALHGVIAFSLVTAFMEITTKKEREFKNTMLAVFRSLSGLPVILALIAGLTWNAFNLILPIPFDKFLEILGNAAIPLALFGIGGSLTQIKLKGALTEASLITALKLFIHPFMAFTMAVYLFKLPPLWIATVTLLAAMPSGIFVSVFAERYKYAEDVASSSIMISTLVSAVSISAWLTFFINNYLSE
jgi:predicted permease|tara:strand:- start:219 stop:1172 length:954 start_codon:yes stop_codon:yes gene_type:complete